MLMDMMMAGPLSSAICSGVRVAIAGGGAILASMVQIPSSPEQTPRWVSEQSHAVLNIGSSCVENLFLFLLEQVRPGDLQGLVAHVRRCATGVSFDQIWPLTLNHFGVESRFVRSHLQRAGEQLRRSTRRHSQRNLLFPLSFLADGKTEGGYPILNCPHLPSGAALYFDCNPRSIAKRAVLDVGSSRGPEP